VYVGEYGGKFADLTADSKDIDEVHTVFAGKYRRYHGDGWLTRLFDIRTNMLNIRDLFFFLLGTLQSVWLLGRLRPDVVFLKGGFVGVPVGLAAALHRRPMVTHDSDAMPGLANRLVSRWVRCHATGMPVEFYSYDPAKTTHVGVLVSSDYQPVDASLQQSYKQQLDISVDQQVLLVTGGSLGAHRVNAAVKQLAPSLLESYPQLYIVHQVGKGNQQTHGEYQHDRLRVVEFLQPMYVYTGCADVVLTRAGANTLAELGVQGKACIVVPNPVLTGGHQLKNAAHLADKGAVLVVQDEGLQKDTAELDLAIRALLDSSDQRQQLGQALQSITVPDAAHKLAVVLLEQIKR